MFAGGELGGSKRNSRLDRQRTLRFSTGCSVTLQPDWAHGRADFAVNQSGPYDLISGTTGPKHLFLSFTPEEHESANVARLPYSNRTTQSHLEIIFFSQPCSFAVPQVSHRALVRCDC